MAASWIGMRVFGIASAQYMYVCDSIWWKLKNQSSLEDTAILFYFFHICTSKRPKMCVFCVHRWVDQSPVTYTHWASGEPNNANGEEQCVQFNRHQGTAGFSLVKILLCLNTRFTERLLAIIYVLLRWMERRQLWPNCRLPLQEVPRRHSHHSCTHTALAGILSCR